MFSLRLRELGRLTIICVLARRLVWSLGRLNEGASCISSSNADVPSHFLPPRRGATKELRRLAITHLLARLSVSLLERLNEGASCISMSKAHVPNPLSVAECRERARTAGNNLGSCQAFGIVVGRVKRRSILHLHIERPHLKSLLSPTGSCD